VAEKLSWFWRAPLKRVPVGANMQLNWIEQIDKIRDRVESEPSLFAVCFREWDITEQAGLRDLAWALARDDSYATRNDAKGLLQLLEAHLTKHALDGGTLPSKEADSKPDTLSDQAAGSQPPQVM
jgi:hypothetical protein